MNASLKGFLSENAAIGELVARDFEVYKPIVDVYGCDLIIFKDNTYNKIQIKSAYVSNDAGMYTFSCRHGSYGNLQYEKGTIDFFMFHLVDINLWFIVPFDDISTTSACITLNETNKYNKYRDAWHLLMEE